jgi:hypothetical protein
MSGWTVAFILYLIPLLVSLVSNKSKTVRDPDLWEAILWPPLMLIGAVVLYLENRKNS